MKQVSKILSVFIPRFLSYFILGLGFLLSIYPFFWALINASYDTSAVFRFPPHWVPGPKLWENIRGLETSVRFLHSFVNSSLVAIIQTILGILFAYMAAYAFAKFQFRGKNTIFTVFLLSMMIPIQAPMLAMFKFFADFKMIGTYQSLMLPGIFNIFAIFLLRQNMISFPNELLESSRIDGCGEWRILFTIVSPNFLAPLAAVAIYVFISSWNNFLWPLMITIEKTRTLPVALSTLRSFSIIDYGQVMAGIALAVLPILVLFLSMQKYFIAGLTEGSVKG